MKLIGQKVGMTRIYDENGLVLPVTLIAINQNRVVGVRTVDKNGYGALQMGYGINKKETRKPMVKAFGEGKVPKLVREFRTDEGASGVVSEDIAKLEIGADIGIANLEGVKYVDVQGVSIGRGFQGVVKRHNMSGGPSGHGSKFHRRPGSIGNSAYPGRVRKGKPLPGHMGNRTVMVQNLKVVKIDIENQLLLVNGAIPGPKNGMVYVKKAVKK